MNKRVTKLCASLAIIIMSFSLANIPANAEEPKEKIKVGYFQFDGYHMVDAENGYKSGYGYEYLQHMRVFSGHEYDYIGDEEPVIWEDMLTMLELGEIDLLTSVTKTEERMEKFDFSDSPIGYKSGMLIIEAGNDDYLPGDYENGMECE